MSIWAMSSYRSECPPWSDPSAGIPEINGINGWHPACQRIRSSGSDVQGCYAKADLKVAVIVPRPRAVVQGGSMERVNAFVPLAHEPAFQDQGRGQYVMEPSHYEPVPKNIADQIIAGRTKG